MAEDKSDNIYKELFNLVRTSGERLIVVNPDTDKAVVVLPLSDYQKLTAPERIVQSDNDECAELPHGAGKEHKKTRTVSFWQNIDEPSTARSKPDISSGRRQPDSKSGGQISDGVDPVRNHPSLRHPTQDDGNYSREVISDGVDKQVDNGRIDTARYKKSISKKSVSDNSKTADSKQDAGGGYYFEPID